MDESLNKSLLKAVKNAKDAFYENKFKKKKVFRKEARRTKRLQKKMKQHQSQMKIKLKDDSSKIERKKTDTAESQGKKKKKRKKNKGKKSDGGDDAEFSYEKYAYEAANKRDEDIISSLGKKLGFKKKSSNKMQSVFEQDGLDYLLEVCNPLLGEGGDGDDSDEEYLKSKKMGRNKGKKKNCESTKVKQMDDVDVKDRLLFEDEIQDGTEGNRESTIHARNDDDGDEEDNSDFSGSDIDGKDDNVKIKELDNLESYNESDENDEGDGGLSDSDEFSLSEDSAQEEHRNEDTSEDGDIEIQAVQPKQERRQRKRKLQETNEAANTKMQSSTKYIPPALRKLQQSSERVDHDKVIRDRLTKQLKGLLNRVSESTLPGIICSIEQIYEKNSRNLINEILFQLISESCIGEAPTPPRLATQHMVIVATVHKTTNSEIGSYFLQMLVERFDEYHRKDAGVYGKGKQCSNSLFLITTLYHFKIVDSILIYDIIKRLLNLFKEQDIEMILMLLKVCGSDIRKDDPGSLKDVILETQAKSMSTEIRDQSRVRYMLDTINALKNNNMRKLAYDPTVIEEGKKIFKMAVKGRESLNSGTQLKVSLDDLLNAKEKGKWWVIGSAWTGRGPISERRTKQDNDNKNESLEMTVSEQLLEIAKKQRMNTNLRKNIFCVLMSSEDYLDAFEKLQKMNLTEKQSREVIHVLLHCCLQEKTYNPFYAHLADHLCGASHSNKVTLQYAFWDRFKSMSTLSNHNTSNMAQLLSHALASKSLSLSVLKVVDFGVLDKSSIKFFIQFFKLLMTHYPENTIKSIFQKIAGIPKLSLLREGIKVFLRHFLSPSSKSKDEGGSHRKIKELIEMVELALDGKEYVPL